MTRRTLIERLVAITNSLQHVSQSLEFGAGRDALEVLVESLDHLLDDILDAGAVASSDAGPRESARAGE